MNRFEQLSASTITLQSGDQIVVPEKGWLQRNPYIVVVLVTSGLTLISNIFLRR